MASVDVYGSLIPYLVVFHVLPTKRLSITNAKSFPKTNLKQKLMMKTPMILLKIIQQVKLLIHQQMIQHPIKQLILIQSIHRI